MLDVGVDIVEIERIRHLIDTQPAFATRVFTDEEIAYCRTHKHYAEHFAVRFAAKEAVIKALGRTDIPLTAISIAHHASGKPKIVMSDAWKQYEPHLSVSLSHCDNYAIAQVVFCKFA